MVRKTRGGARRERSEPDGGREGQGPARRVLMVLYFFPPLGGVSMSRNVRNVQYLPEHGWCPVVITPRDPAYHLKDPAGLRLVPSSTIVIRTRSFEAGHARSLIVRLGDFVRGRSADRPMNASSRGSPSTHAAAEVAPPEREVVRAGGRLERWRRLLFFPDDQAGWLPFAVMAGLRAHRATPVDAIYSTSSPITAHLIAAILKHRTGLPWIAEFRDPWLGNALAAPLPWFHRRLQARLERWIVGSADRVIGVSDGITNLYRARYPTAPAMETITSGYDRGEASATVRPRPVHEPFRIVYTGTLDRPVELEIFFNGLSSLLERRPTLADELTISFYGNVADACRSVAERYADRIGAVVRFHGFVPRQAALAAVADADAALILLGPGPGMGLFIGGKLFDYIGQNVQILAMLPRGDSRAVLESLDWGVICEPDPNDVAEAIERLVRLPRPDRPADPSGRFDRAFLAQRLAHALDEVAGVGPESNDERPSNDRAGSLDLDRVGG